LIDCCKSCVLVSVKASTLQPAPVLRVGFFLDPWLLEAITGPNLDDCCGINR
jgi:hypothetical protein